MSKFDELRRKGTQGANYELSTEALIAQLEAWDSRYGVEVSKVEDNAVLLRFDRVPEPARELADEIFALCPDIVHQGFGCYDEMIEAAEEMGQELEPEILELVEGIDFDDENFGVEILTRSLRRDREVGLWWD